MKQVKKNIQSTIVLPLDLRKALTSNPKIQKLWDGITTVAQRDFVSWIESAKQPETRARRIEVTCSKLTSGKRRPCCYAVVPLNLYTALNANLDAKTVWKNLTPDKKRDIVDEINSVKGEARIQKIEKICSKLAGKK